VLTLALMIICALVHANNADPAFGSNLLEASFRAQNCCGRLWLAPTLGSAAGRSQHMAARSHAGRC